MTGWEVGLWPGLARAVVSVQDSALVAAASKGRRQEKSGTTTPAVGTPPADRSAPMRPSEGRRTTTVGLAWMRAKRALSGSVGGGVWANDAPVPRYVLLTLPRDRCKTLFPPASPAKGFSAQSLDSCKSAAKRPSSHPPMSSFILEIRFVSPKSNRPRMTSKLNQPYYCPPVLSPLSYK